MNHVRRQFVIKGLQVITVILREKNFLWLSLFFSVKSSTTSTWSTSSWKSAHKSTPSQNLALYENFPTWKLFIESTAILYLFNRKIRSPKFTENGDFEWMLQKDMVRMPLASFPTQHMIALSLKFSRKHITTRISLERSTVQPLHEKIPAWGRHSSEIFTIWYIFGKKNLQWFPLPPLKHHTWQLSAREDRGKNHFMKMTINMKNYTIFHKHTLSWIRHQSRIPQSMNF